MCQPGLLVVILLCCPLPRAIPTQSCRPRRLHAQASLSIYRQNQRELSWVCRRRQFGNQETLQSFGNIAIPVIDEVSSADFNSWI